MHGEALSRQAADFLAETVHQRLAVMGTQVVHRQMDGAGFRIAGHDLYQIVGELGRAAVGSRFGEMASGLGFNAAEDVGRAAPFIFAVAAVSVRGFQARRGSSPGLLAAPASA